MRKAKAKEEKQQIGFWNNAFVVVLRWIFLIPISLVLFELAEYLPLLAVSLLESLNAPLWAVILILLFGGGTFLVYTVIAGAALAPALVGKIAPRIGVGFLIVGVVFFVMQLLDVIDSIGKYPWYIVVIEIIVGFAILIGMVFDYAEETQ
jgi:hypothetical protein